MPATSQDTSAPLGQTRIPALLNRLSNLFQSVQSFRTVSDEARQLADDAISPLTLVIMGQFKAGKSTFINALLGEDLLTTDVLPSTAAVTVLRSGTDRSLVAHSTNGRTRAFNLRDLALLSAEGDPMGASVRRNLSWLEVRLPSPVLNDVCLVDTPGLDSTNPLHAQATLAFIERADAVVWVFSALQTGSKEELKQITKLPEGLRPFAVVNQIDQLDEQEQTVDSFLSHCGSTLKRHVQGLVGVSARLAIDARANNDREALIRSKWPQLHDFLNQTVLGQTARVKAARTLDRARRVITVARDIGSELLAQRKAAAFEVATLEAKKDACVRTTDSLLQLASTWRITQEKSAGELVYDCPPLPDDLTGAKKLNHRLSRLREPIQETIRQVDEITARRAVLEQRKEDLERQLERHNSEVDKFNTSGLFGGPPVFDGGEGDRLNARLTRIQEEGRSFDADIERFDSDANSLAQRAGHLNDEASELVDSIISAFETTIQNLRAELENCHDQQRRAATIIENTEWAAGFASEFQTLLDEIAREAVHLAAAPESVEALRGAVSAAVSIAGELGATAGASGQVRVTPLPVRLARQDHALASANTPVGVFTRSGSRVISGRAWLVLAAFVLIAIVGFIALPRRHDVQPMASSQASETAAWDLASSLNSEDALKKYMEKYPSGEHRAVAEQILKELRLSNKTSKATSAVRRMRSLHLSSSRQATRPQGKLPNPNRLP